MNWCSVLVVYLKRVGKLHYKHEICCSTEVETTVGTHINGGKK